MGFTLTDGTNTVELKARNIMRRKKWRLQNIPLMQQNPYCFDLGLETDEVEVVCYLDQSTYDTLMVMTNPVEVQNSSYPELPNDKYRMEKVQANRKAGWVKWRECTLTLLRDYWA